MNRSAMRILGGSFLVLLVGCALRREPVWIQVRPTQRMEPTAPLLEAARANLETAGDGASVDRTIAQYEALLKVAPQHYEARVTVANLYILKGTAYTAAAAAKSRAFQQAMTHAELAMATRPAFRAQVEAGRQPWEAAASLGAADAEAMYFWVTALQYDFKEGMSLPGKIVNVGWLQRALVFLNRIEVVAPEFGGGGVEVAKMICLQVLPRSRGGSKEEAAAYMRRALAKTGDRLMPRWANGKYYLPALGQKQAAAAELAWVAAQDPKAFTDPYPWRVHFQDDARRLGR